MKYIQVILTIGLIGFTVMHIINNDNGGYISALFAWSILLIREVSDIIKERKND